MSLNFLEKTLESPLDSKEIKPVNPNGNQHWIFIGRTDAEAEAQMLHLMWRANTLEKTPMLGKIEGRRRRGQQRKRWLNGINDTMDIILSKLREIVKDREAWRAAGQGVAKSQTWLSNWTIMKGYLILPPLITSYFCWIARFLRSAYCPFKILIPWW